MGNLSGDFRSGFRFLRRNPAFAAFAILTLALGIGANTAIFSVLDAVLLRPLPYEDDARLMAIWEDASFVSFPKNTPSPANFADWRKRNRTFQDMAAARSRTANFTEDGAPELVFGAGVTSNFFSVLRVKPQLGRAFLEAEDRPGSAVVLLSHGLWVRRYGADRSIVGRPVRMNGEKVTVVGVMPPGVRIPYNTTEYWIPIALTNDEWNQRQSHFLSVVGRLKDGVSLEQARADMNDIAAQLEREHPASNKQVGAVVTPYREEITGNTRIALWVLLGAAGAVLLIACANIANLMLAKASARGREMAVRAALGAGKARIAVQLLSESLVVAAAGCAAGISLARLSLRLLEQFIPEIMANQVTLGINARMLVFAVVVSVLAGLLFGLAPAWRLTRVSLLEALKQGGRGGVGGEGHGFRNGLVVAEVAMAVVLLVGAADSNVGASAWPRSGFPHRSSSDPRRRSAGNEVSRRAGPLGVLRFRPA